MTVTVLGIRHHGPGCARSVAAALDALAPDAVLVEGPPEGDSLAALAAHPEMAPPVALLVYAPGEPGRSAFWPFAAFSPEWLAVRHAAARDVPLRFIDLPAANTLAFAGSDDDELHTDPLAELAQAAGYGDPERWWEDAIEHRLDGLDQFAAVSEAMAELRRDAPAPARREAAREAAMRRAIRAALREGFERIAVVCGAWHAPALDPGTFPSQASDTAALRGLAKIKVAATWVPWTHERLSQSSGYGAGVRSPGWYAHLFSASDAVIERWLQRVAGLLREEDLDASAASVIEAVRLAEALAALRGRPLAGLDELDDAARSVLCGGAELPLSLIRRRLTVGDELGAVPAETPMVPLARDVARLQRSLRLPAEAAAREKDLDLRKDTDLARSHLLHRLQLLGVDWGELVESPRGALGTFHEHWLLAWRPELAVALIDAGRWGTTVAAAAEARARARAAQSASLAELTALVEACLLAELPGAVRAAMAAVAARAAGEGDVGRIMEAVVPLARVGRYGSVRREDVSAVLAVVEGLVVRVCVGLPQAVASLDDEAAAVMTERIGGLHASLGTLARADLRERWLAALAAAATVAGVHGMVGGRATRLLLDAGALDPGEAGGRLSRALSPGTDPPSGAAWVEGFLSGSGVVLLHDPALLAVLDGWVAGVPGPAFEAVLPLLRRTFATFATGERRQIGERLRRGGPGAAAGEADALDPDRLALVLPTIARLLG